jgi:hypothetical protein
MFKLYFLTYAADVVASVNLNYQLIQNSLHLGLVRQINPYKSRSLTYY